MTSDVIIRLALKYWKEILMGVLLITVVSKFHYDYKQLEAAYEASQESLEEQIAGLKEIHERELIRRDEALQDYRDALAELERNYLDSQVELERQKRENRRRHVEDFSGNQENLINDIRTAYGFIHVP